MAPLTLAAARAHALRERPGAPLITDCTQGRIELSHATFDNWVCKTVNLLRMEAEVAQGCLVAVTLPLHWMAAVWCVAVWESGADLSLDPAGADLTVGTTGGCDVFVVADPLGMTPAPAGIRAEWFFPADVRRMPDQLVFPPPPPGAIPGITASALAVQAMTFAEQVGLAAGGRLGTDRRLDDLPGVLAAIAAPLAAEAAVVYGSQIDAESPTARA